MIAGIILADRGLLSEPVAFVAGMACAAYGVLFSRRRCLASLGVAFFSGGLALAMDLQAPLQFENEFGTAPVEVTFQADVVRVKRFGDREQWLLENAVAIEPMGFLSSRLLVYRDRINEAGQQTAEWLPGDTLRLRARLRTAPGSRNPGARDRRQQLARSGVGAEGSLVHPGLQVRVESERRLRPLHPLWKLRAAVRRRLEDAGSSSGLLRALALGDRGGLSDELRQAFAGFGIAHLLAVSGLHLVLVAAPCYRLLCYVFVRITPLARARDPRRFALVGVFCAALFYALFAGWGVPIQRAFLFLAVLVISFLCQRRVAAGSLLSLAALIVLSVDPSALFAAGAQLSFAATGALLFARPRSSEYALPRWILGSVQLLRATATVLLVTAPLTAWHFGSLGLLGLLWNLVAVPWTAFVLLPAALLSAMALGVGAELEFTSWILEISLALARCTEWIVLSMWRMNASWVPAYNGPPPAWVCLFAFGLGLAFLQAERTRVRLLACFGLAVLLSASPRSELLPSESRAIFLDVGQGDAVLIQSAADESGKRVHILVDAGTAVPGGFDAGERVVVPALRALGVDELELLIVSHADLDHSGGVPSVIEAVPVREIWIPKGGRDDPGFLKTLETAVKRGVPVTERGTPSEARGFGIFQIETLWPPQGKANLSRNDRSLSIRVTGPDFALLLAGDLERRGEAELLATGQPLKAQVLKLNHHGSRTSSTQAFLEGVDASLGIVSAPCRGRFRMPHREAVQRSQHEDLSLWWTGRDGAVIVGLEAPLWVASWASPLRCGRQ